MPPANWQGKRVNPHQYAPELFALYLPVPYEKPDTPLHPSATLGDLSSDLAKVRSMFVYRRIKQPIKVYYDDAHLGRLEHDFHVDFAAKVVKFIPLVCRFFGLRPAYAYEVVKGDVSGALKRVPYEKSLLEAAVPYNSWVMLRRLPDNMIPPAPESVGGVNLWEDEPVSPANLIPVEGTPPGTPLDQAEIEYGTLNKLVERLTHTTHHSMDFQKTFLMTYESFTTSEMLVTKLLQRYDAPRPDGMSLDDFRKLRSTITLRIVNVMRSWLPNAWEDLSESLKTFVTTFITKTLVEDGWSKLAKSLFSKTIAQVQEAADGEDDVLAAAMAAAAAAAAAKKSKKRASIWNYSEREIAEQMCLRDFELFAKVKPRGLISMGWEKPKNHHLCPGLMAFIGQFNSISSWTVMSILSQEKLKARIKRMEFIIRIGKELAELNGFNALMAVVSGLNSAAMLRLKFTKAGLNKKAVKMLEELEAICSAQSSYKTLRGLIAAAKPPTIPYPGVAMQDLTFINDGNEDANDNGLINFGKRRLIFDQVAKIQLYQNTAYNFEKIPIVYRTLSTPSPLDEKALYQLSLTREPRGCSKGDLK